MSAVDEVQLKIAVLEDEPVMLDYYTRALPTLGHEVVVAASTCAEAKAKCRATKVDLLITDIRLPDGDGILTAREIAMAQTIPVVLISAHVDDELIARSLDDHVVAYLVKPISDPDLHTAISVAVRKFQYFLATKMEADHLRETLQFRKLLERAKGILTLRAGVSNDDALHRLQKLATEKNKKLVDICQMIVDAELAMHPPKHESKPRRRS